MEHRFLTLFVDGKWTGNADRSISVREGSEVVTYNLDEYAKAHGIELPDAKKHKKTKIEVNSNADMGHEDPRTDTPEHGDGNSEGQE